ncbi:MAG: hypothetical protein IJM81_00350 [Prevotella sp.]|nr:hypothetical protein [Bacteroidales bacterium]MBQ6651834.1 hypothetical protein [Prevotella sp.]
MRINYQPTLEEEELRRIIEQERKYCDTLDPQSTASKARRSMILKLERVLRCLEMRSDYFMSIMAEELTGQILKVRKHPMAADFVGMLLYYELKPRYEWRDDGLNPIACTGNVRNWPTSIIGLDGKRFVADDPNYKGWEMFTLKGEFVPIPVDQ